MNFSPYPGRVLASTRGALTVVRLTIASRIEGLGVPEAGFIDFLRKSFGQKRKTLWNNLKSDYQRRLCGQPWRSLK